jgi:membrane fusion protein (multidrug efflux system)
MRRNDPTCPAKIGCRALGSKALDSIVDEALVRDLPSPDILAEPSAKGANIGAAPSIPAPRNRPWRRFALPAFSVLAALALVAIVSVRWDEWGGMLPMQTTDDAYIRAEAAHVGTRVSGQVLRVAVHDYERVKAGDLLVEIDPGDYAVAAARAEAGVAGAQARLDNLNNEINLASATIDQAEARHLSTLAQQLVSQQEFARQKTLMTTAAGNRQKLEQAVAEAGKASSDVKASVAAIAAERRRLEVLEGTRKQLAAELHAAQAALSAARLQLGYSRIVAPFDGIVGERQVQVGDYVGIGSALFDVVPLPDVYVIAHYKETQLTRVLPGQDVDIKVDSFPNLRFQGSVERISPASDAQFALLPPDNATGNFTKVVQRIAVRIKFNAGQPDLARLLPGMSAVTKIHVDHSPKDDLQ